MIPASQVVPQGSSFHAIEKKYATNYIQLHEYEAILFSDIDVIDKVLRVNWHSQIHELRTIVHQFSNPEIINNNPNTAPSKRLKRLYDPYQKVTDGVRIAKTIPLDTVKNKCRHFNDWITRLEGLSGTDLRI
jgi:hypothetical protein